MKGRHHRGRQVRVEEASSIAADPEAGTEDGLGGGGAQADQDHRSDGRYLAFQPRPTSADLVCARLVVQPSSAAPVWGRPPFEVLDHVGHVCLRSIDAGLGQGRVEQLARRPDEGMTGQILLVAGRLAHEHHPSAGSPSPKTAWVARA